MTWQPPEVGPPRDLDTHSGPRGRVSDQAGGHGEAPGRWAQLGWLALALLLAMAPWFSSVAVSPLLREMWGQSGLGPPLLTVAVQLGFAAGALLLAIAGVPDVVPGPILLAIGALVAGAANLTFALFADGWAAAMQLERVETIERSLAPAGSLRR